MADKKFEEEVSNLLNTSVEDARSSLSFTKLPVLHEVLRQAELKGYKTLFKIVKSEIRRREKGGRQA